MQPNKATKLLFSIFFGLGVLLTIVTLVVFFTVSDKVAALVVGIQALVWLLIGGIGLGCVFGRIQRDRVLRETGNCIKADIVNVYADLAYSVNGRHPYRLSCQYKDEGTQTIYVFKSNPLWFDPTPNLTKGTVDVYIDYNNFKKYFVDVDSVMNGYKVEVL